MQARSLNCPNCGAPARNEATQCQHCGTRLATVACPACFGMMFLGSRYCPWCGSESKRKESRLSSGVCPHCQVSLHEVSMGKTSVSECHKCHGLWIDLPSFEKICADREEAAPALGTATVSGPQPHRLTLSKIRYLPCPECRKLMHRVNFANCSGVIVDVCKPHGTWFDCDELRRIIEFIHQGGLAAARAKEKSALETQRRQIQKAQAGLTSYPDAASDFNPRSAALEAARGVISMLMRDR